ncbi:MAG: FoF1-type ATP synthase, membrane subunit b or b' [Pelagibacterales bacterium]|nr:FoF1-type ATP synthase, membrane subunit b or b' [Pelagibacterales bacterium]
MRLFFLLFIAFKAISIDLFAAEAGMPQLDPKYWASQAFWLTIIFILLYLSLSQLFIPKIKKNIDDRENKIKEDLEEAEKLKEMAEKKQEEYDKLIEGTKKEVYKIILESKNKLGNDIALKKKSFEEKIDSEILKVQNEIQNLKKESLNNISLIAEEIASGIIKQISGDSLNQSSIKAAVDDSIKKNVSKYL